MLKPIRKIMNKPVKLHLIDRTDGGIEQMGGGIEDKTSEMVLLLRGLDISWLVVEWQYSGQFVIIPVADIICIASDLA